MVKKLAGDNNMTLTEKWVKDRLTQLKNEIKALKLRVKQMHSAIQQTEHVIMMKNGEIKAINEVAAEMQQPAKDFHIKTPTPILSKKEKLLEKARRKKRKKAEKKLEKIRAKKKAELESKKEKNEKQ